MSEVEEEDEDDDDGGSMSEVEEEDEEEDEEDDDGIILGASIATSIAFDAFLRTAVGVRSTSSTSAMMFSNLSTPSSPVGFCFFAFALLRDTASFEPATLRVVTFLFLPTPFLRRPLLGSVQL